MFTVHNFSKKNITEYVRNIFNSENHCFHYLFHKRYSFSLKYLCHNYFRRHSRMRQIALFIKSFCENMPCHLAMFFFCFFLQGRFYLKNRQKPTATLIYTDNIIYNIYTTYIPPPPIINTFSDVKIHVSKVHVHQNSKR